MVDIKKIADIACLGGFEYEEKSKKHIESINRAIGFIEELNAVDTGDIEPFSYNTEQNMRCDAVIAEKNDEKKRSILANAPETDGDYFLVPKVIK